MRARARPWMARLTTTEHCGGPKLESVCVEIVFLYGRVESVRAQCSFCVTRCRGSARDGSGTRPGATLQGCLRENHIKEPHTA